jgi:tRNA-guanine transglycosylase
MNEFNFKKLYSDPHSKARLGIIHTPHGDIQTPAFVPVGTQASVKSLSPEEIDKVGTQLFFVNTYHMYLRPGIDVIKQFSGLHSFMHWNKPLITDSGGFQVFSLAKGKKRGVDQLETDGNTGLVAISEEGVKFQSHWDGSSHTFTPELSMQWQWGLGSDIHIAFDDCTPYPVSHEDAKSSMERTHRWAIRSLEAHKALAQSSKGPYQALYGSVQGSVFEDLRKSSASFISSLDVDGIAVGGVSVGESKEEMVQVLDWVMPVLPDEKPRHLLGVGEIDDIFALIESGIDTFDCVQPTRLARVGWVFSRDPIAKREKKYTLDITKSVFANDPKPLDESCSCYTCTQYSRAYVHHLFHVHELLGYRLATIHNLHTIHKLTSDIRDSIKEGTFLDLKRDWLYYS